MPSFACASSAPEPATGARIETPAAVRDVVMMDEIAPRPPQSEDGLALTRPQDPVFATGRRTSLSQRNATRALAKSVERAELADVSFHTLRHTFASLLIAHGRDPLFVADQLGHASAKTMLDVYSHLFRAAREAREARSQLDAEYGRCCGREQTERKQQRQKMAGNPASEMPDPLYSQMEAMARVDGPGALLTSRRSPVRARHRPSRQPFQDGGSGRWSVRRAARTLARDRE